jgi:hypothetical protein
MATDPSGKLCKIKAVATKIADFFNLLPAISNLSDKNRKNSTTKTPTASQNKIASTAKPTLLAAGSSSIKLIKIIVNAAISNEIATTHSDNLFFTTTISQPIMVLKAASIERRKPIWLLVRFITCSIQPISSIAVNEFEF